MIGLRRPTEQTYRAGIIPISADETEDHWQMIDRQLQAVGWKTFQISESECRKAPSEIAGMIRTHLQG